MESEKIAVQRGLLAAVTPELIAEFDRLVRLEEALREGIGLAERDLNYTRPHAHQTKFMQGIVTGGDSALGYIRGAMRGE